ncbi:TetR family transcriptional regulator [Candidatus Lucifugimonas marina]|jgi:AcrR family transcriptional regulator|uniref:TetR family transcriptional regulator n=1 Tax=Candidatus Lucifugimonas marina TaxID=3038979 RepID=A0AAJ5ZE62_9CHLR|nr:TetR family transcriptional regulator [SAR202 cluster bacterium JH702]MDG0868715.1 TetR family transcriptional regulator [SAR202 cluster bacterium JH639]WFG35347.1 TetR family transcriptional regulator [SAR202 cluster bacterium JH545]WFG39295.1 TetR family transcriptional regulator [SAR202 cluster bacterium JH1073]
MSVDCSTKTPAVEWTRTNRLVGRWNRKLSPQNTVSESSTLQRTQTRERILEAAETVFADNGYHDALIDEIGKRTSMSKGGLYFHFPSKEDLFFAVMDRLANKLVRRAEKAAGKAESPLEAAEAALDAVLSALSVQKRLARLLITQGYSMGNAFEAKRAEMFDRFAGVIKKHLDEAARARQIDQIDTDLASRVWLGAVNEVVVHWLFSGGTTPKNAAPDLKKFLVQSVMPSERAELDEVKIS